MSDTEIARRQSAGHGKDHRCGAFGCHPVALQKCANIKAYCATLAILLALHLTYFAYAIGIIRTKEKRFGLRSKDTALLMSLNDIIQTFLVVVVAYMGRKTHKPRYLSVSSMFSCIGMFLAATPYFIFGPMNYTDVKAVNGMHNTSAAYQQPDLLQDFQMCHDPLNETCTSTSTGEDSVTYETWTALYIFAASSICLGFGMSGIATLGLSFIDENVKKEDTPIYLGVVTSMFSIGPIFGFGLAAVCTRLSEDLGVPEISVYDPRFVGCWWLGYVIAGSLVGCVGMIMFFFPKHFRVYYIHTKTDTKLVKSTKQKSTFSSEIKEFPKVLWKLLSNRAYIWICVSKVFKMFYIVGVIINMNRYIEIHFGAPAFFANIAVGLGGALTGGIGNMLGGILMKKLNLSERSSAIFYVLSILVTCVGLSIMMIIPCPQGQAAYDNSPVTDFGYTITSECNIDCECSRDHYQPICSRDGQEHFSPCHAGCLQSSISSLNSTFSECSCVDNSHLSTSWCSSRCDTFSIYIAVYAIQSFLSALGGVPMMVLTFRVVEPELKAFALGLMSAAYNVLVFIPGPIIFGALFDSACTLWKTSCGETRNCLVYDIAMYRYYMHGISVLFEVGALLAAIMAYFAIRARFPAGGKTSHEDDIEEIKALKGEEDMSHNVIYKNNNR